MEKKEAAEAVAKKSSTAPISVNSANVLKVPKHPVGTFVAGSCKTHPASTTHNYAECSSNPDSIYYKDPNLVPAKSVAVHPKPVSQATKKRGANAAMISNLAPSKKPWVNRMCETCRASPHEKTRDRAKTHNTEDCYFKTNTSSSNTASSRIERLEKTVASLASACQDQDD